MAIFFNDLLKMIEKDNRENLFYIASTHKTLKTNDSIAMEWFIHILYYFRKSTGDILFISYQGYNHPNDTSLNWKREAQRKIIKLEDAPEMIRRRISILMKINNDNAQV